MPEQESSTFRSGFVGIMGRPNVGKSTFLNRAIGEKVAIVTPKPQTTRDRIMGIAHFKGGQIIFLDTPGVHESRNQFNKQIVATALKALNDADLLYCFFEPPVAELGYPKGQEGLYLDEENTLMLEHLVKTERPKILVLNKVDVLDQGAAIGDLRGRDIAGPFVTLLKKYCPFEDVFLISAETGEGIDELLAATRERLPEGPEYFPEDMFTDQTDRAFAAEVIREKVFLFASQEVPYQSAVTIEEFDDDEEAERVYIRGTIHVERPSQRGILIGRRGQMLKKITSAARRDIKDFLGRPVYLRLTVQVTKNWSSNALLMKRLAEGL